VFPWSHRVFLRFPRPPTLLLGNEETRKPLTLLLAQTERQTHDTRTLRFRVLNERGLRAKPGQFLTFHWIVDGHEYRGRTAFPPRRSTTTMSISRPSAWKMAVSPFFSMMIRRNRASPSRQAGPMADFTLMRPSTKASFSLRLAGL